MGKEYDKIPQDMIRWIKNQQMFFVSTAPLSQQGHINCSPKGLDSFVVDGDSKVAYLDVTGSGAETIAHIKENGRIVVMFCEFSGAPNILRLYGKGVVHQVGSDGFEDWINRYPHLKNTPAARAVIEVNVSRVTTSCGYGVPKYDYQTQRETLDKWGAKRNAEQLKEYHREKNSQSVDGLPAMEF